MDPKSLVDKILHSNEHIRYVAICDRDGKIVHADNNEGISKLLTQEETEKNLQRAMSAWKSREELYGKTGEGKFALAVYENLKRVTMPVGRKHLAYVTFNTEGGNNDVVEAIRFNSPVDDAHELS